MSTEHSPQGALPLSQDLGMKMSNQEASGGGRSMGFPPGVLVPGSVVGPPSTEGPSSMKVAVASMASASPSDLCRGPECLGDFDVSLWSQDQDNSSLKFQCWKWRFWLSVYSQDKNLGREIHPILSGDFYLMGIVLESCHQASPWQRSRGPGVPRRQFRAQPWQPLGLKGGAEWVRDIPKVTASLLTRGRGWAL